MIFIKRISYSYITSEEIDTKIAFLKSILVTYILLLE